MEERLKHACEFMRAMIDHATQGGGFRHLIYDRLGFGAEAYVPLYEAGGMEFTNACPINLDKEIPPTFLHVGIGQVVAVEGGNITMLIDDKHRNVEMWEPTEFKVGEPALFAYFSTAGSGCPYAFPAGKIFSSFQLDNNRPSPTGEEK